jgi:hypothetical protein
MFRTAKTEGLLGMSGWTTTSFDTSSGGGGGEGRQAGAGGEGGVIFICLVGVGALGSAPQWIGGRERTHLEDMVVRKQEAVSKF